jgi:hypothetical protein
MPLLNPHSSAAHSHINAQQRKSFLSNSFALKCYLHGHIPLYKRAKNVSSIVHFTNCFVTRLLIIQKTVSYIYMRICTSKIKMFRNHETLRLMITNKPFQTKMSAEAIKNRLKSTLQSQTSPKKVNIYANLKQFQKYAE